MRFSTEMMRNIRQEHSSTISRWSDWVEGALLSCYSFFVPQHKWIGSSVIFQSLYSRNYTFCGRKGDVSFPNSPHRLLALFVIKKEVAMIWAISSVNVADSSTEGVFKETVSSHNQENFLEATKVVYTDLTDETLKQAVICLKTMLQFLQAAIPCLNVHSEGGASDRENHTNDGRYLTIYPLNLYLFLFSHYYLLIFNS